MSVFPSRTILLICTISVFASHCKKDCDPPAEDQVAKHINDSLWAYYPVKGSLADATGNNHILALNAGAALTFDQWGFNQEAINFDGNDDYGSIADGTLFPKTDFSISLFVMPRQNKGLFFGKHNYATAKASSFNVGIDNVNSGPNARFSVTSPQNEICDNFAEGGDVALNTDAFNPGAWYHVVITFAGGNMKLYVNGALAASKTSADTSINNCSNGEFILGGWWSGDHNAFDGKMDEIRIYKRSISPEEVKYLFDQR